MPNKLHRYCGTFVKAEVVEQLHLIALYYNTPASNIIRQAIQSIINKQLPDEKAYWRLVDTIADRFHDELQGKLSKVDSKQDKDNISAEYWRFVYGKTQGLSEDAINTIIKQV